MVSEPVQTSAPHSVISSHICVSCFRWMNRLGLAAIGYTPDDPVPRPDEGEITSCDVIMSP